jgi:regulator of replication initiation timing
MEEEWSLLVCEKNISLFQNNSLYKIMFDIKQTENTYTNINEIVKENELFELLYELNKDVIDKFTADVTDNNRQKTTMTIINKKTEYFNHPFFTIHIHYDNKIDDENCSIFSIPYNNSNVLENEIYLSNFNINISKDESNIHFLINFSFDDNIFENDLIKMTLSMYIQKIFYRLKLYFE